MDFFLPPLLSERCYVIHYTESIFSPLRWLTQLLFNRFCLLNLFIFAPVFVDYNGFIDVVRGICQR